jgi:DNA-binding response OmpR family regulator
MRRKILVVEDDVELLELLAFNFRKAGFQVGTASDGIEALKKARSLAPDLVVLDAMLPEMDGFAVCETLRRDPATASLPVLMLTALSGSFPRIHGLESGVNDFMTKPFNIRELLQRIETLLHNLTIAGKSC